MTVLDQPTPAADHAAWHLAVSEAYTHPKIVALSVVLVRLADPVTGHVILEPGNLYRLLTQTNLLPPAARQLIRRLADAGWLTEVESETLFHDAHWGVWALSSPAVSSQG